MRKIKYKIAITSFLIIFVLGALLTTIDLVTQYNTGTKIYKNTGRAIIQNIGYQITHFAYTADIIELQRIINNTLQNNPYIEYIFIVDSNNKVIVHSFNDGFPTGLLEINNKPLQDILLLDDGKYGIYDFSYPIDMDILCILRIGINRAGLIGQIQKKSILKLFLLLGFLILGIILSSLIGNTISKPINKLVELTKKVSEGNFEYKINIESKDEIGLLAGSFKKMCNNLKDLTVELTQKVDDLNNKNAEYEMLYEEYSNQNEELSVNLEEIQFINTELLKAKDKAEESDRLKTAFLANISHEIRTPMNGIMGFADMLKSPDLTKAQQNKYIDIIEKSGKRMLNIIHNLIDISMIESNQANLHTEAFPVNNLIDELYTFFKPQAEAKKIHLIHKKELTREKDVIHIDKNKVTQILSNLLNNAIKFTDTGRIIFGYEMSSSKVKFYVHDTGIGIDENMKKNIFKRFEQADYSYSKGYDGSGLGLSISKAYVEMHGGEIWVDSCPGKGSSFYFTIPHESGAIKKLSRPIKGESPLKDLKDQLPKRLKLLIAEDDLTSYLFLQEVLLELNYELLRAGTGLEAVDIFKQNPDIDLVLMDIKMPVMDGIAACKRLKQINPSIPVIIQSAYTHPTDKQNAIQAGCNDYITKPLIKKNLLKIIAKYVAEVN